MKKHLLCLLSMLITLPTFAIEFEFTYKGQTLTYIENNVYTKTVSTKKGNSGNNVSGDLEIPKTVKYGNTEYTVTKIGYSSFDNCSGLTSVKIPDSVTEIGGNAFDNCSALSSMSIGSSVKSIGYAFFNCNNLNKVEFASIESLCSIHFFNQKCNPLYYAHNLYINGREIKELYIPSSVTSIGSYSFSGCIGLTSVTIPNSVTSIGRDAFCGCTGLTEVTIPNSVTSIGWNAFCGCTSLTEVTIPNSVTLIGSDAFCGCTGLTEVTIPNSVTTISNGTFQGCTGLISVTIPNSVTSIGSDAFRDCSGLIKAEFTSIDQLCKIKFGDIYANPLYNAHNLFITGEEIKDLVIPNTIQSIGDYAFCGYSGLVNIPNSVTTIGAYAFFNSSLREVIIPRQSPQSAPMLFSNVAT